MPFTDLQPVTKRTKKPTVTLQGTIACMRLLIRHEEHPDIKELEYVHSKSFSVAFGTGSDEGYLAISQGGPFVARRFNKSQTTLSLDIPWLAGKRYVSACALSVQLNWHINEDHMLLVKMPWWAREGGRPDGAKDQPLPPVPQQKTPAGNNAAYKVFIATKDIAQQEETKATPGDQSSRFSKTRKPLSVKTIVPARAKDAK